VRINRINEYHHSLLRQLLRIGDTVVDCTVGNGNDTVFLAEAVGHEGRVIGFDIQAQALCRTRKRLVGAGIEEGRFTLVEGSHSDLGCHVPAGIGGAVYNLGYLPGGDRSVVTGRGTTLHSIAGALELLRPEGFVSATLYYGHEGGREEADGVLEYVRALDHDRFKVAHISYPNLPNDPPSIVMVQYTPRRVETARAGRTGEE
jgi:SAM-dependent methyltransferase